MGRAKPSGGGLSPYTALACFWCPIDASSSRWDDPERPRHPYSMSARGEDDLYAVLEVTSSASHADILAAFRKKARTVHPDVSDAPDADEQFRRVREAYDVLRDRDKRSRYDAAREKAPHGASSHARKAHHDSTAPNPNVKGASSSAKHEGRSKKKRARRYAGDLGFEDIRLGVDDLLGRRAAEHPQEITLNIPLETAFTGTTMSVLLERPLKKIKEQSRFKIRIPVGAKDGDQMRLNDPDVLVTLRFKPHPRFEVQGKDLITDLELLPWDAALGTIADVVTPTNVVRVRIPEGASTGQKLRLKGQGIPSKPGKTSEPGDLYARIKVVVPNDLSEAELQLLRDLKRTYGERHPTQEQEAT